MSKNNKDELELMEITIGGQHDDASREGSTNTGVGISDWILGKLKPEPNNKGRGSPSFLPLKSSSSGGSNSPSRTCEEDQEASSSSDSTESPPMAHRRRQVLTTERKSGGIEVEIAFRFFKNHWKYFGNR